MAEKKNPVITIEMTNGDIIKAELYPDVAPNTVNNFLSLVNKGFYNGLIFHRVIKGFMIQGGCPDGNGMGGPGYCIKGEFSHNGFQNDLAHTEGVLSMARAMNPNSAGSQFFIMHKDAPYLNGEYAAFGQVIDGMDIVNKIAETPTDYRDRPMQDQKIKSMTVDTFGVDYPEPEAMVIAAVHGGRIAEHPVVMKERENGESSITLKKSVYYMCKVSLAMIIRRISFGVRRQKR